MAMAKLRRPRTLAAAAGSARFNILGTAALRTVTAIALCSVIGSCSTFGNYNDYDEASGASRKDYGALEGRRAPPPQERSQEPPIPDFQSVVAAPTAPELADTRRVSISVTETTPVRDILIELARKAQVDLELDPRISGGIIMTATDRPFIEVIQRITDLAELRYTFDRNRLKVELDDPYIEQYRMDILNITRNATSSASSSTDAQSVAQAIGGSGGGGGGNKSETTVNSTTRSDFWNTVGSNINQILNGIQSRRGQAVTSAGATYTPEAESAGERAASAAPAARSSGTAAGGAGARGAAAGSGAGAALAAQAGALTNGRQATLNQAMQQDQKEPAEGEAAPQLARSGAATETTGGVAPSQYSLSPEAGIITVFATQRQQRAVERFLRDVRESLTQQVLIEAKVLEITLNDNYRGGIDWNAIIGPSQSGVQDIVINSNFKQGVPSDLLSPTLAGNWAGAILGAGGRKDLSLSAELFKQFGTVRTLSNPRLSVLNNQLAQLKVAQNQVFFQLQVNVTDATATAAARTTVTSQIKTVPVGLIISVQPAVDPVTKRISLSLRPSITRITSFINDPGVAVTIAVAQQNNTSIPTVESPIPIIEVREMDSLVNLESGQTVVMGGLMQESVQTTRTGVPGLMDIPLVGQAAAENVKQTKVTELVVFIRATLANAPGTVTDEDIRLYKTFTPDPRPIAF
jgi:general secretion pathway protein D